MDKSDRHGNTRLALTVAAEHLNIPQLLEVEDLCDKGQPDDRSVMTYIASYFHAFSSMGRLLTLVTANFCLLFFLDQTETDARRVEKFADLIYTIWLSRNDYEKRCCKVITFIADQLFKNSSVP